MKIPLRAVKNKYEAQALCNFLWNEIERHKEDIRRAAADIRALCRDWEVKPAEIPEFVVPYMDLETRNG